MPDYICPDCGGLVTCLSCVEIHAGHLPQGPAFVNQLYDPDWYRNDYLKQPKSDHNEERQGAEDRDDRQLETIGVNESLSFDLSHFTDTLKPDHQRRAVSKPLAAPSQKCLFGETAKPEYSVN
jgi:hypothetical protein